MNDEEKILTEESIETLDSFPSVEPESLTVDPALETLNIENNSNAEENTVKPKKKKKINIKLLIILILLVLAIGVFVAYQLFMSNPYNIYKTFITKTFDSGSVIFESDVDIANGIAYSGDVKVETNEAGLEVLKDYTFDYSLGVDIANEKAEFMLGLSEKESNLVDVFAYLQNDNVYLKSEKLYDKLLSIGDVGIDFSQFNSSYSSKDIEYLYNKLELALLNALTKDDFKTASKKITVSGKSMSVKENYVDITSQNIGNILERFINTFKMDDKALEIISTMLGVSKDDIITAFDALLNEKYEGEGVIRISIYTKPILNSFAGYSFKVDEQELVNAGFNGDNGYVEVNLDSVIAKCNIKGNVTDCTVEENAEVLLSAKYTKVSDKEMKVEVSMFGIAINVNYKVNSEDTNKSNVTLIVEVLVPEEDFNVKVTLNTLLEYNKSLGEIDVNDAKDINQLTDPEMQQIMDKLQKILEPTAFYGLIESLMNTDYNSNVVVPDSACETATCTNCSGDTCECEYYDNSFTLHTITCPNSTYY